MSPAMHFLAGWTLIDASKGGREAGRNRAAHAVDGEVIRVNTEDGSYISCAT